MGVISCNCNYDNDKVKLEEKNDELKFTNENRIIITPNNSSRKQKSNQYNLNKEIKETTPAADKTLIDRQNNSNQNNQNNTNQKNCNQKDIQIIEVPPYIEIDSFCEKSENSHNNNKEHSENCSQINDNTVIDNNVNKINQLSNIKFDKNFNCYNINNNCDKEKVFPSCTSDNNNNYTKSNNTVRTGNFCINNTKELKKKIKNYKLDKIDFGLGSNEKDNLSNEQKELYHKAEKNLNQFLPPQNQEIHQIQKIMENIVLNLNSIFQGINALNSSDNEDIILFSGILKKMINYEINTYKTTLYSDRFCVLFPKTLKYYKSKAQFLKNLKPMCVLPINQISRINIAKSKKSTKKVNHLIICNKFEFQQDDNSVFLNFFDTTEISDYSLMQEDQESLIIFTNDDEKMIYKWYIILQILIENLNK